MTGQAPNWTAANAGGVHGGYDLTDEQREAEAAESLGARINAEFMAQQQELAAGGSSSTTTGSKRTYIEAELEEARQTGADPMTAEEALAFAEREGLTLVRSTTNKTGFKNLQYYKGRNKGRPYQLKLSLDGRTSHIGSYATPEEAALTYARLIGPEASAREAAEAAPAMTPEEALAAAEAEGLTLVRSNTNTTGFKHVVWHKSNTTRPYALRVRQDGHLSHLGQFATPEEAALEYVRRFGSVPTPRRPVAGSSPADAPPQRTGLGIKPPKLSASERLATRALMGILGGGGDGGVAAEARAGAESSQAAIEAATAAAGGRPSPPDGLPAPMAGSSPCWDGAPVDEASLLCSEATDIW